MPAQGIHIRRAGNPQREGRPAEDKKLRAELCNVNGEEGKNREEGVTGHGVNSNKGAEIWGLDLCAL